MEQDTGKNRMNIKDQFYTCEAVAKLCVERICSLIPNTSEYVWIEPSAGNGVFLKVLPTTYNKIGLDIDPKSSDIVKQDYLKWNNIPEKDSIVFGNPPFGRQSSLAKSFIRKSCRFASVIAFILPKSFMKPSMYNVFDMKFHCIDSFELEKDSFILNGSKYDVPCIFQIWKRQEYTRPSISKIMPKQFEYRKNEEDFDIAIRRVGVYAGKCYIKNESVFNKQTHYFIKFEDVLSQYVPHIIEKVNAHIFPSNTVGPRSLSKSEINEVLNRIIDSVSS